MSDDYAWWQKGIVYQIYPRSFQDANRDGVGDLRGIIQRLDYVASLGVDAVWLSPIYPSPMADFGYDVADYTGVHPLFGDLDDFDALREAVHQRGLKLILDLVPNHTSDQHPWFLESRSSRDNPKRDWYFWRDPQPDGAPPNNWLSCFGGPAWTLDPATGQYYLHQFARQQPELNYQNPQVMAAMQEAMRFWLGRGIDGFRVDVIEFLSKHPDLPDEPPDPDWNGVEPYGRLQHIHTRNRPDVVDMVRQLRSVVDEFDDRVMIGEVFVFDEAIRRYYGEQGDGCHLPFNFRLIYRAWDARTLRREVDLHESFLDREHWPNWVLGNHDQHRIATRIGLSQARVANMLLLTLRGTPTTYYGEELGLEDVPIPPHKVQDPPAVNQPEVAHIFGRDPERTPMQWDDSPNAGFCDPDVEPWLPVAADYTSRNVAAQEQAPHSMLALYRALTGLRRAEPALSVGDYRAVEVGDAADDVFAFRRDHPGADGFLIVLNLNNRDHTLDLSAVGSSAHIAVATDLERGGRVDLAALHLRPDEGLVLRL